MKELTEIMNVQITFIGKMKDDQLERWERVKPERIDRLLKNMKEEFKIDDIILIDEKMFVADVEG